MRNFMMSAALSAATAVLSAQGGVDQALLLKPLDQSWPTYSGDYSGRRYSRLAQINQTNVKGSRQVPGVRQEGARLIG
jgi:alcohol dehydrogenase (cytochrome c)